MINIKAAHHIYGNVEKEHSPNKVGGFQTLFYTRARLSEEEVEEIEEKLVYHQSETNPVKWLFFPLGAEKVVVSHIVLLTAVDKFGREGKYLAHSIVLSMEDFINADCNPFIILNCVGDQFLNSAAEALKRGNSQTGNFDESILTIDKKSLETMETEIAEEVQKWDGEELKKMAHYTINYQDLQNKREALVFTGNHEQIVNALKIAVMFVPKKLRLNCTFDTYFYGCNLVKTYFWATGYTDASGAAPHFSIVNTSQKKITAPLPSPVSPYEEWVYDCISREKFRDILAYNSTALELQRLVLEHPFDNKMIREALTGVPKEFFKQIAAVYRTPLINKIKNKLAEIVGIKLVPQIIARISSYSNTQPQKLFHALLDGFDSNQLAEELYDIYKKNIKNKPPGKEMRALKAFLEKTPHEYLDVLMAVWKKDYTALTRHLDQLSPPKYAAIVERLIKKSSVPPARMISTKKTDIFLEIFINHSQIDANARKDIPALIKKLISMKQESKLKSFCPIINRLTLKQIKKIKKIVEKQEKKLPLEFLKTLDDIFVSLGGFPSSGSEKSRSPVKALWNKFFGKKMSRGR